MHDVAPETWPRCERLLEAIARVAPVPVTLLVVPNHHLRNPGVPAWYRDALAARVAAGDELALHGYFHVDEGPPPATLADWFRRRILTASEGEFSALPAPIARRRLYGGRQWFERQGWPVHGFVAPAWLIGRGAWHALSSSPFVYTTTATHFHLLHPWQGIPAPALAWSTRSRLRRALSLSWHGLRPVPHDPPLVRLALHPDDALHADVVRQALHLLELLLRDRKAMTKLAFATALRPPQVLARPRVTHAGPPPSPPSASARSSRAPTRTSTVPPLASRARHSAGVVQGTGSATSDRPAMPLPITTPASTSLG